MAVKKTSPRPKKIVINRQWCKGCGICAAFCHGALVMDCSGKATVRDPSCCTGCGSCESHCPDFAITIEVV